jgi:hypothetical protein
MFYFLSSKVSLISNINDESRFTKIFIVGTVLYILLHAYLYSSSNQSSDFIVKYSKYLYYIWGADLAITGIMTKLLSGPAHITENTESDEEIQEEHNEEDAEEQEVAIKRMSAAEIEAKLAEIKMNPTPSTKQDATFPFIRREMKPIDTVPEIAPENPVILSDTEIQLYAK